MIEQMKVVGIAVDNNNMPIIVLKNEDGQKALPIWVGIFEAQAILFALEGILPPRPLTHDLLKSVIETMGGEVDKIVITALCNNTYFAKLFINYGNNLVEVDSRPSDAIALALRTDSPIFVTDHVISTISMPQHPIDDEEMKRFKEELKNLNPKDIF
ncbi:MAG: bifunctional nuclease family protein [bacterium]